MMKKNILMDSIPYVEKDGTIFCNGYPLDLNMHCLKLSLKSRGQKVEINKLFVEKNNLVLHYTLESTDWSFMIDGMTFFCKKENS